MYYVVNAGKWETTLPSNVWNLRKRALIMGSADGKKRINSEEIKKKINKKHSGNQLEEN